VFRKLEKGRGDDIFMDLVVSFEVPFTHTQGREAKDICLPTGRE